MPDFRFLYKNPEKKMPVRNNICIGADHREDAIALFETDYPELKWYQIEEK